MPFAAIVAGTQGEMFVLAVVEDKIKVNPEKFDSDTDRVRDWRVVC